MCNQPCENCSEGCERAADLDVAEAMSPITDPIGLPSCSGDFGDLGNGDGELANWASGVVLGRLQDCLAAGVEARLTQEVRNLAGFLRAWSGRAKFIGEVLPANADCGKVISLAISLICLHLSDSFLKDANRGVFMGDGALDLIDLGLKFEDCVRELDLDGLRFLCVAHSKHPLTNASQRIDAGERR